MRLAYIDESRNADSYWFGSILVPEQADAALQPEIIGIPARYAKHGLPADAEFPLRPGRPAAPPRVTTP